MGSTRTSRAAPAAAAQHEHRRQQCEPSATRSFPYENDEFDIRVGTFDDDGRDYDDDTNYGFDDIKEGSPSSPRLGPNGDIIKGGEGLDALYGEGGDDHIYGGGGTDWLFGDDDQDELFGEDGDDQLYGGDGNDFLDGGEGSDWLDGGTGMDTLVGGPDGDWLTGEVATIRFSLMWPEFV